MYYLARAKMDAVTPYKPSQRQGEKNPVAPARGGTPSLGRWGHIRAPHWQSLSPDVESTNNTWVCKHRIFWTHPGFPKK